MCNLYLIKLDRIHWYITYINYEYESVHGATSAGSCNSQLRQTLHRNGQSIEVIGTIGLI